MANRSKALVVDHDERLVRAYLSLEGLSLGDAFGRHFFYTPLVAMLVAQRALPAPTWRYTDDTMMALSVYETLASFGGIDQDDLARRFARRYADDPGRAYGPTAGEILQAMARGTAWPEAAGMAFGGEGSMGNGSAMRVGPVGAYFADDADAVVRHAMASAAVTHAHPDGQSGAAAIALAVSYAWRISRDSEPDSLTDLCDYLLERIPDGPTAQGIRQARELPVETSPEVAAAVLGNGSRVTCANTVPFCVWCAAGHLNSFEDAMWATVSVGGDMDTTCAIVGSIVSMAVGASGLPEHWISSREPLDIRQ